MDEQAQPGGAPPSGSVEEQLEVLQDDVNLLKIEIKQTLVDLREYIINTRPAFHPRTSSTNPPPDSTSDPINDSFNSPGESVQDMAVQGSTGEQAISPDQPAQSPIIEVSPPTIGPRPRSDSPTVSKVPVEPQLGEQRPLLRNLGNLAQVDSFEPETRLADEPGVSDPQNDAIDVDMLVELLKWLDSIKGKGITPEQVAPFLQAYEARRLIAPHMVAIILRSVWALHNETNEYNRSECTSEEYLAYLQTLHDIVCAGD